MQVDTQQMSSLNPTDASNELVSTLHRVSADNEDSLGEITHSDAWG